MSSLNQDFSDKKQTLVKDCIARGLIVEKDALEKMMQEDMLTSSLSEILDLPSGTIISKNLLHTLFEKNESIIKKQEKKIEEKIRTKAILIEKVFTPSKQEKDLGAFVGLFNWRYERIKEILLNRTELRNAVSIGRFGDNSTNKAVSIIGIIGVINKTKTGKTAFQIEDTTGSITVLVSPEKDLGQDKLIADEIIGVRGNVSRGYLFAESLVWPDVPLPQNIATAEGKAVFISDLHFGSFKFIQDVADKFISWIRSPDASDVKYLFIAGDLVDGVGIYPGQEAELLVKDIQAQYNLFSVFLQKIPSRIEIIICPGNHDAVHQAEPQPPINKDFFGELPSNVHLVSNPAWIRIPSENGGVRVLMYHGTSFPTIIDSLPYLRQKSLNQPQFVMREVLKARHLAPLYGSAPLSPESEDWLVIDKIPDIFHTGNIHAHAVDNYKGITCICSSTFQAQTAFMDRMGLTANPGKVTVVDLSTRKVTVIDFLK